LSGRICDESPAAPWEEERLEASSQKEDSGYLRGERNGFVEELEQRVHQQDGLAMTTIPPLIIIQPVPD